MVFVFFFMYQIEISISKKSYLLTTSKTWMTNLVLLSIILAS